MTLAALMILGLVAQARQEKVMIYGDHGRLDAVIQTPETQPGHKIPMVIICHGFTGNKDELLLRTLADSLERQGVGLSRCSRMSLARAITTREWGCSSEYDFQ